MSRPKKSTKGDPEWLRKLIALRCFFGCNDNGVKSLVLGILGRSGAKPEDSKDEAYDQIYRNFKNYGRVDPEGEAADQLLKLLVDRIQERWQDEGMVTPFHDNDVRRLIFQSTAEEFVRKLFPKGSFVQRTALEKLGLADDDDVGDEQEKDKSERGGLARFWGPSEPHTFQVDWEYAIREAMRHRRLDQKLHYFTPSAEANWRGVATSGNYHQYEQCKEGLRELFYGADNQTVPDFFRGGADTAVMLGCGAGAKDELIIRGVLDSGGPASEGKVRYFLVDTSPFMLDAAYYKLLRVLRARGLGGHVALESVKIDFVDHFREVGREIRNKENGIVWFLPGGTLGNLDEHRFFESISNEAAPGDLLVVGVDTISSENTTSERDMLRSKYTSPEVKCFLREPLLELMKYAGVTKVPDIEIEVVPKEPGQFNPYSRVPQSKTVEFAVKLNEVEVTIMTSTRYNIGELIKFAQERNFAWEMTVDSPLGERFKQVVFRRV